MKFATAIVLLFALASVASARPVSLRSLMSAHKDPIYCSGLDYKPDECPEHYECAALKEKVCKDVQDCVKDKYGKEKCTYKKQCWEYACVEIPKYCEVSYAPHEDECVTKYGKDLMCEKLDKEVCVYDKECKYVDTKICLKYNQEQKCKVYKQEKKCKPADNKCTKYYNGKCTEYGHGKEEECEYVPTKECKEYEYVNTTCKEYKQEEVCEDKKVCWNAKCVKVQKKTGYAGK